MSSDSSQVVLVRQDINQIILGAVYLSICLQNRQQSVVQQITSVKQFFDFYQQNIVLIPKQFMLEPCVPSRNLTSNSTFLRIPRFCYQANGISDSITLPENNSNLHLIQTTLSLLNQFSLLQDTFKLDGVLKVAAISEFQFFGQFPYCVIIKNYDITQRPWFKNHINQSNLHTDQQLFFSSSYQFFPSNQIEMAVTQSILFNDKIIAIAKQSNSVNKNLIPQVPYNILLIDGYEEVVFSNIEDNSSTQYVYNENKTGFNQTDWNVIKQFSIYHTDDEYLQLQDKRYNNTNVNVHSELFLKENFTLIVSSNVTDKITLLKQFKQIQQSMNDLQLELLFSSLPIYFVIIILEIVLITLIFKPIVKMTGTVINHILQLGNTLNFASFKSNLTQRHSNDIVHLRNSFINLQSIFDKSQHRKSEVCRKYESIQPFKKEHNLNTKLIHLYNTNYLTNNRKSIGVELLKINFKYVRHSNFAIL